MADDNISDSGLWIDDKTGKVVNKQPAGGATQLVRPGGRVTDAVQARIDEIQSPAPTKTDDVETAVETQAVETTDLPAEKKRRGKAAN